MSFASRIRLCSPPLLRPQHHTRTTLLGTLPGFDSLPPDCLASLATRLQEETFAAQATIVREGEPGDRCYLIVAGKAELSVDVGGRASPLGGLGPGDYFGELALLVKEGTRQATITAVTELRALSLEGDTFRTIVKRTDETGTALIRHAERLMTARFLKTVGAFATLDSAQLEVVASRITPRNVAAGELIVRQGEPGESCFMVRSGRVEVLVTRDGVGELLATLSAGALFGEGTLVTGAPRSASVRAIEPTELLELDRQALLEATRNTQRVGRELVQLLRLREFPQHAQRIELHERTSPEGEQTTVLKNPTLGTYYRLSPRGRFVWERLDGRHDLRQLTLDFLAEYDVFAPDFVADLVGGLAHAGFLEVSATEGELGRAATRSSWSRMVGRARRAMDWQISIRHADALVATLYRRGVRLLFTRPGFVGMAALALFGITAFVVVGRDASHLVADTPVRILPWLYGGLAISIVIHEAGHAFATTFYGRTVPRAGIGLYWLAPVAFVDTSDMWLGTRRERIVVSLAGPAADLVTAGVAGVLALSVGNETVAAGLWAFTLPLYLNVLLNLNPLLEFDGYHILTDIVDRPNLRAESLAWLRGAFPRVLRSPSVVRRHGLELAYGACSLAFVFVLAAVTIVLYRAVLQSITDELLPHVVAVGLSWLFAGGVVALTTAAAVADMRRLDESRDRLI